VLTAAQTRKLLDSIKDKMIVGLRDRALIGLMTYSFARVAGAALGSEAPAPLRTCSSIRR
jgi:site-specific recombinase XerD